MTRDSTCTQVDVADDDWNPLISELQVAKLLSEVKPNKFSGDPEISSLIYKTLSVFISSPLAHIFQACINQRKIPEEWKKVSITPVPKEKPIKVTKLRPISQSLLPTKIFERILLNELRLNFEHMYGEEQHGFRRECSTTTALVAITHQLLQNHDDKNCHGSVLMTFDMHRAFDNLDHKLIIEKFLKMSVPKGFVLLLKDYLYNRFAHIKLFDKISRSFRVTVGVPQGTVLAPYIFGAFFGDFHCLLPTTKSVKYADDLTVIVPVQSVDKIENEVNCEIENIQRWCSENRLTLNLSKSKILFCFANNNVEFSFSLPIECVDKVTVLGFVINKDLSWDSHIDHIVKIANRRFYALRKLWLHLNTDELHMIYTAYIRTIVEYACPIFAGINKSLTKRLKSIDIRAHKIIYRDGIRECRCASDELIIRRNQQSIDLYRKIESSDSHILSDIIPNRLLHTGYPIIPLCRTIKTKQSFVNYTARLQSNLL